MYCPCRLRCMLGNSFSWACSVIHQRFTHIKYLWLFGYFPSPLNKTINEKSSYDYIWWLKEDNLLLSKDSFWMQCLGPKHDCIWCINQSSQTVDWKIKVEREKKTLPNVTLYNYAWVRRHANHWIKYCGQSNRQTIIKKTSQNQTHLEVNTLVHGAFLQHWVKNAGSFMHNRNLCHTYVFNN